MKLKQLFTLLAIVAIFFLLRFPPWGIWPALDLSLAQAVAAPFLLLVFLKLSIADKRVHRGVLIVACLSSLGAVWYSYAVQGSLEGRFVVARLQGDEHEMESSVFRERINFFKSGNPHVEVTRYHAALHSPTDAEKVFRLSSMVEAVVWGDSTWINVSFPKPLRDSFQELSIKKWYPSFHGLKVVTSISMIGLPYRPENDAAQFLSLLFGGLPDESEQHKVTREEEAAHAESLLAAATLGGDWRSQRHRAFAWWALGNHYLFDAVRGEKFQTGEVDCALNAYASSRKLFNAVDDPELFSALENNIGVALYVRSLLTGEKADRKSAKQYLDQAMRAGTLPDKLKVGLRSWKVAKENYLLLSAPTPEKLRREKKRNQKHHKAHR